MQSITIKSELSKLISSSSAVYKTKGKKEFVKDFQKKVLNKKVRFPLLEFAATELYKAIPEKEQLNVTDEIISLKTIGGNVIAGIILQNRLSNHFKESIDKACEYIIDGNEWYVCDIIGERVMGFALLTLPEKTIPVLRKLTKHSDKWIVRSVGVAAHYAIKKGLKKKYVEEVFQLLLSLSNTTDFHTKKGIGWAAKTTAKFHPEIVEKYRTQIDDTVQVKQWFRTKIKTGKGRSSKYASRYTG